MNPQTLESTSFAPHNIQRPPQSAPADKRLRQIYDLLNCGKTEEALTLASKRGAAGIPIQNARAVCLMRLGDPEQAVRILRSLTVTGGVNLRSDAPLECQINFATALAMSGNPLGAVRILDAINADDDPRIVRLRNAIADWKSLLSLWERIQWIGGVALNRPVPLAYEPGELITSC